MSTVEANIKIRGDTSRFQSALTDAGKAADKFFDNFKKRMDKLDRLKINPRISITDNVTDALKRIEQLSNRVKSSLSSISVSVNVSPVEQAVSQVGKGMVKPTQEASSSTNSLATTAAHSAAVVAAAAPFVLAHESWQNSRNSTSNNSGTGSPPDEGSPPPNTSLLKKALPKLAKAASEAFAPLNIAKGLVGIVQADNKGRATAELIGETVGGIVGFLGGPLGSLAGSAAGGLAGGVIYDRFWGKEDANAAEKGNAASEQQNRRIAATSQAIPIPQEAMVSTGQAYLDSQNNIITSNELITNSQNNLVQSCSNLTQAVDIARAKLISFSGVPMLPLSSQNNVEKHATGGILSRPHLGLVAEAGPEAIIPLSAPLRSRALALWQQAGEYLGVRPYATGGLVGMMPPPIVAGGGGVNVTVPVNVNLQVSSENIDYDTIKNEVGWKIAKSIKNALENRATG